ncbi:type II secretion system F family protein [Ketobacter sp.]|uniref:type II secretion system F family protein n=1 Tax=Ketobacter sp. TaxID=2083498 RepID=UPI000F22FB83|nr:type II secretion system F family protein [Ketobacter sp.]MEE2730510.1 type II secretion system F family protein [Pseudomonadota bacterium]RLU00527.1 MAG: hypothetical protein D9N14_06285 [Ketobacter sp.]
MYYVVQYLDAKGEQASLKVEAPTREEARWLSRIPERRIISVREDMLGQLSFVLEPPGPDRKNQALFMQSLSSSLSSGKTVKQSVEQLVKKNRWLKVKPDELDNCENLADYLELFRFDHFAVLMARAAEKAGEYSGALRQSAQFLLTREKIKSEVSSELKTGLIYIFVGSAFFFVVPAFLDNSLQSLMGVGSNGFVKPNNFTHVLMGLGQATKSYAWVVLPVAGVGFFYRNVVWSILKRLPLFNLIETKRIQERSIEFVSVYEMLQKAGYVDSEIVAELMRSTRGQLRASYQRVYAHLAKSEELGDALTDDEWDDALIEAMQVFNEVDEEQQGFILDSVKETLHLKNVNTSRQISKFLSRIGFLMMVLAAVVSVLGFYLPLAGAASNVNH